MPVKRVSSKYAQREFVTIGLVLILYALFVLFLPLVLNEMMDILPLPYEVFGLNTYLLIKLGLMIIGTILPFSILKLATKKNRSIRKEPQKLSFSQTLCQSIVFFTLTSASIFASTAIANAFGISGELVSGIGISIDPDILTDAVYVFTFIVISPILEEFAFRGVLLNSLSRYGKYFALTASAIIYSLAHGSFMEFLPSFIMGILLGKLFLRYRSIKPVTIIHILFNLFLYLSFIIPEKYTIYMSSFYALIYILAIVLFITRTYRHIIVKKSASNSKVTIMFLTTFTVMVSIFLFIAHSILTILLK